MELKWSIPSAKCCNQVSDSLVIALMQKLAIHPLQDKLKATMEAPTPQNVQELRLFLGLISYYGKFIPNAATIVAPLNELLCKDAVC